jgi:hypothetical protein
MRPNVRRLVNSLVVILAVALFIWFFCLRGFADLGGAMY